MALRVAEQYKTEFGRIAKTGNTIVVPASLGDVSGMIALATNIVKNTKIGGAQ